MFLGTWRAFWRTNGRCGAAPCLWLRLGSYGRPARADSDDPAASEGEPQDPVNLCIYTLTLIS
jgi:hypothetical protein